MVEQQLLARDITVAKVLQAMAKVPREKFVPAALQLAAYTDGPLPIGHDQTISQPYIVAFMTQALQLRSTDKVLEVGTGSGYQAAVLSELVKNVYSIEMTEQLYERAQEILNFLGYKNIHLKLGDGRPGWPEQAPFNKIIVTAGAAETPPVLLEQLAAPGRLIIPLASGFGQELILIKKDSRGGLITQKILPVAFVPLR